MIFFSDALNIVSGFWRFLAFFTNIINRDINSFIFDNTSIIFIEIIRP